MFDPLTGTYVVEAEDLEYAGYRIEENSAASGGKLLGLLGNGANKTGIGL